MPAGIYERTKEILDKYRLGKTGRVYKMKMIPEIEIIWLKSNISFYLRAALITTALAVCLLAGCHEAWAEEISEDIAIQCILGEARGEYAEHGYPAFLAIADALRNRGTVRGVYGCKADMGKERAYMANKGYYRAARQAWLESKTTNVVNGASHWESTDFKIPYWAKDMIVTYQVGKHKFYREVK